MMARDDKDQRRDVGSRPRLWRVGEQRAVVGGCLQTAFAAEPPTHNDAELMSLLGALEGAPPRSGGR